MLADQVQCVVCDPISHWGGEPWCWQIKYSVSCVTLSHIGGGALVLADQVQCVVCDPISHWGGGGGGGGGGSPGAGRSSTVCHV